MKFTFSLALSAVVGAASNHHAVKATEGTCGEGETGYEVWARELDPLDVNMTIDTKIDGCTYQITMSFHHPPGDAVPFMNDVDLGEHFATSDPEGYKKLCNSEGLMENATSSFLPGNVAGQTGYTDYGLSMKIPEKSAEASGFKMVTIGASPCGTLYQPFPHYSIHFYNIDKEFREGMTCKANGGYFCKPADQQTCSESGTKMQVDGVGVPICPGEPQCPGVPKFANVIADEECPGFLWTTDEYSPSGMNAATPGMGLHGIHPKEFAPGRPTDLPYLMLVQYDSKVRGFHLAQWSGFLMGKSSQTEWDMPDIKYNCQDEDHWMMPTSAKVKWDKETGRTLFTISGNTRSCLESFTESVSEVLTTNPEEPTPSPPETVYNRCDSEGELVNGSYCPGMDFIRKFEEAMNAWGQHDDLSKANALWVQSDDTILCVHPPGCFTGTQNIIMGLAFVGAYITAPYKYTVDYETWESGGGFIVFNRANELFTTVGGCQYPSQFFQFIYFNEEGLITQSHFVFLPEDPRIVWLDQALKRTTCDCDSIEAEPFNHGMEVFQPNNRPATDIDMKIETSVDAETCMYHIDMSFIPDNTIPYMGSVPDSLSENPTADDLLGGLDAAAYNALCMQEGRMEWTPIDFANNVHYTDYNYVLKIPDQTAALSGFNHITVSADPCGTIFQPNPHYGIHFYMVSEEKRQEMRCFTEGGSFCKSTCRGGDKFGTDGNGITTCDGTAAPPAGPGVAANVPSNFTFTTDALIWLDEFQMYLPNAATPAIGLHALDFATLDTSFKPVDVPNLLSVQYDGEIVGHMIQVWNGFMNGKSHSYTWEKDNIEYNCQTQLTLPTKHGATYNTATGRTHMSISGPVSACDGLESFTESNTAATPSSAPSPVNSGNTMATGFSVVIFILVHVMNLI